MPLSIHSMLAPVHVVRSPTFESLVDDSCMIVLTCLPLCPRSGALFTFEHYTRRTHTVRCDAQLVQSHHDDRRLGIGTSYGSAR